MGVVNLNLIPRLHLPVSSFLLIVYPLCLIPVLLLFYFEMTNRQAEANHPKGCRMLGLRAQSNVTDEFDPRYEKGWEPRDADTSSPRPRIKAIFTYPLKSCAGVELQRAKVLRTGLEYDRHFCFALWKTPSPLPRDITEDEKAKMWAFVTLRAPGFEKLALVKPEVWAPDPSSASYSPDLEEIKTGGVLLVKYPHGKESSSLWGKMAGALGSLATENAFRVPLVPPKQHTYPLERVAVWKDVSMSVNMSNHIPEELKACLQIERPFALFRNDPEQYRKLFRCAPRLEEVGYQPVVGFADAYPLHIMNLASVRDIGKMVANDIPKLSVRRFRPNIVFEGLNAYEEDSWKKIRIGGAEGPIFYVSCRTARCKLPNVDPDTGERHKGEPDKILRAEREIDKGAPGTGCLGMQMVPAQEGILSLSYAVIRIESLTGKTYRMRDQGWR